MIPNHSPRSSVSAQSSVPHAAEQSCLAGRSPTMTSPCQNPAEHLLRMGRRVLFMVRHGAELDQIVVELGIGVRACRLASTFASGPDCLKLRALVENWSMLRIRTQLQAAGLGLSQ